MSTLTYTFADSATMLRRNLRHMLRYPVLTGTVIAIPVVFLLLFVFVFGGTLGAGLTPGRGGRADYVNYVTPGIVLLAIAGSAQGTAIGVAIDMTEGIIARFRTMSIARASVLTGHVVGNTMQTMAGIVVVLTAALVVGFRPDATPAEWLTAIALLAVTAFAVTWLCVALGLAAKSIENASNVPMPLLLLPFLGSGFVPTASMPTALRWFADNQPFTPVIETLRGLLLGSPIGASWIRALVWCAVISAVGYVWARRVYERLPSR